MPQKELDNLRYLIQEFSQTPERNKTFLLAILTMMENLDARIAAIESDLKHHTHRESGSCSLLIEWD